MRIALRTTVAALALTLGLAGCDKASEEECEASCLHFSKLSLAEEKGMSLGSPELAEAWAEAREREELEQNLYHCVQMCEGRASARQTSCIIEAETLADAEDCSGVSRARSPDDDDVDGEDDE